MSELEQVFVSAAAEVPLSWVVVATVIFLMVCVRLSWAAEEESIVADVRRESFPAIAAGQEERAARAQRALNELLAEIDVHARERVAAAARTSLLQSGVLVEGEPVGRKGGAT